MGKLPAIFLYDGDWLKDGVAGCSLGAQGLWLRMMFIGHNSERYGYLQQNGKPIPSASIARRCGCSLDEYLTLLQELDDAKVPSRTPEGVIFSRRMVRDAQDREAAKNRKRKERCHASVTPNVTPLSVIEDEDVKKEKIIDELVFDVLAGLSIPTSNPVLVTAIGEAIEAKGKEPGWSRAKAALHMVERGNAYKSSAQWHSQFKKSWPNWFKDQCYDQDPGAWKSKTEQDQRGYIPLKKA